MATWTKCGDDVTKLAAEIMRKFPSHHPLLEAGVTIDLLFARAEIDDKSGEPTGCALKHQGVRALGIARKISLKDRAAGRADAEIAIDGDWWESAGHEEREALLDHELYHLSVRLNDKEIPIRDDLGRPKLVIRKHDIQIGWFHAVAERHKQFSIERQQARSMMTNHGQYYWPDIVAAVKPEAEAA